MISVKKVGDKIQVTDGLGPKDKWANHYFLTEEQVQQCLRDFIKCHCGTCLCCLVGKLIGDKSDE